MGGELAQTKRPWLVSVMNRRGTVRVHRADSANPDDALTCLEQSDDYRPQLGDRAVRITSPPSPPPCLAKL